FYRAVVGGVEQAGVLEGQRSALPLVETVGQADANGGILGDALTLQRLPGGVGHLVDAQSIMEFEDGCADVVESGELHLRLGGKTVGLRSQFHIDVVVVDLDARALGSSSGIECGKRAHREQDSSKGEGTSPRTWCRM